MDQAIERGRLLFEAHRWDEALKSFAEVLTERPDDATALKWVAWCHYNLNNLPKAWYAARDAVHAAPDDDRALYVLAAVAFRRRSFDEAERAITRARELAPQEADYCAVAANLKYARHRYLDALDLAEAGLKLAPENDMCARSRVRALLRLDRAAEARGYLQMLLAREPENSLAQAQLGWTALQQNDRKTAVLAFREALRMDPEFEWARQGLLEALRLGVPLYRYILAFHLKLGALSDEERMILGVAEAYVARIITIVGCATVVLFPVSLAYLTLRSIFIYLTWAMRPITALFLRLHPFGRFCLDDEEKSEAAWAVPGMVGLVATIGLAIAQHNALWLAGSFVSLYAISSVGAAFIVRGGWPRWVVAVAAMMLLALGAGAAAHLLGHGVRDWVGWVALLAFVWLRQGISWLATLLAIFTRLD